MNIPEGWLYDKARKNGYRAIKRGWPDFFCFKDDGTFFVVEVKPHRKNKLKFEQRLILEALASYGVPSFRWSPGSGFERVHPAVDFPEFKKKEKLCPSCAARASSGA